MMTMNERGSPEAVLVRRSIAPAVRESGVLRRPADLKFRNFDSHWLRLLAW